MPAVLHPAAHDEPCLYLPVFRGTFGDADAFCFHTASERLLVERTYPVAEKPQIVLGLGVGESAGIGRSPRHHRGRCDPPGWRIPRGEARQDRQDRQEKDQVTRIVVDSNVYISASLAECPKRSLISSKARTRWASTSHDRSWTRWPKCWPGSLTGPPPNWWVSCHPCGSDVVCPGRRGPLHRHWR